MFLKKQSEKCYVFLPKHRISQNTEILLKHRINFHNFYLEYFKMSGKSKSKVIEPAEEKLEEMKGDMAVVIAAEDEAKDKKRKATTLAAELLEAALAKKSSSAMTPIKKEPTTQTSTSTTKAQMLNVSIQAVKNSKNKILWLVIFNDFILQRDGLYDAFSPPRWKHHNPQLNPKRNAERDVEYQESFSKVLEEDSAEYSVDARTISVIFLDIFGHPLAQSYKYCRIVEAGTSAELAHFFKSFTNLEDSIIDDKTYGPKKVRINKLTPFTAKVHQDRYLEMIMYAMMSSSTSTTATLIAEAAAGSKEDEYVF